MRLGMVCQRVTQSHARVIVSQISFGMRESLGLA
jgi:hypothetical protein